MANESFSVYPEALDGYSTLPLVRNQVDEIRAEVPNRLRDAIVKIEQELGVEPSGTYATVRARLDAIGDVAAELNAHLLDATDAHDASAISVLDSADNYVDDDVEAVLAELGSLIPPNPDVLGADSSRIPNSGTVDFFDGYGTKFAFNTSSGDNVVKKTQPSAATGVRGLYIVDISTTTDDGTGARLEFGPTAGVGTETVRWRAPGDSFGSEVDVSGLSAGDIVTLSSGTSSKKIRVARTSAPYAVAVPALGDNFEVYSLNAKDGVFSLPSEGFKTTKFVTRTSSSATGTSRLQFMIGGMVFPADRGTLVLQRKLRGSSEFFPIAVLDLGANFTESLRSTGQPVYTPSLSSFDTFLLYDRVPVSRDYAEFDQNASGQNIFEDYTNDFSRLQVARYKVPASNSDIVGGTLIAPTAGTESEADDNISAYRMLHYKSGVTDFTGQPASTDLFSVIDDSVAGADDGHHPTRISSVVVDDNATRPGIEHINLRPTNGTESTTKMISGIHYYNGSSDTFDIELRSKNDVFANTYVQEILHFTTDVFNFPNGTNWGAQVTTNQLADDGYWTSVFPAAPTQTSWNNNKFSSSNLPDHGDQAFYIVNSAINPTRRIYPAPNEFSTRARINGRFQDPFGFGDGYDAYGADLIDRILVNSYATNRATVTQEWFTDESYRVADSHEFLGPTDAYVPTGFDNTAVLVSGSLQCGGRFTDDECHIPGLIYPQSNYKAVRGIRPVQQSGTNYGNYIQDRTYRRTFTLGYSINGGKLRIQSDGNSLISFDDIRYKEPNERDRFGKIEVKIPGYDSNSTGWLDIGRLFRTGHYKNGDGALSGAVTGEPGNFVVPFTFGPRNNSDTENKIAVKVTYFGQHEEERAISKQKIMTLIQLLP